MMIDLFGRPLVPASHSAVRVKEPEKMIQGTYGRTFIDSPVPPGSQDTDLLSLWENRLRVRLATIGSTESALIWRAKESPLGWSISRLAPSTRHTNATALHGQAYHPTPLSLSFDQSHQPGNNRSIEQMRSYMPHGETWPTAQARDGMPAHSPEYVAKHKANGHGMANRGASHSRCRMMAGFCGKT